MAASFEMIPVTEQWQIFFTLFIVGLALAFIFDCYRVGRYFWIPGIWGNYIGDFVFWIIFSALFFFLLLLINWGELRVYVLLAICAGVGVYMIFLGSILRRGLYTVGRLLERVLSFCCRLLGRTLLIVFIPGRWMWTLILGPFNLLKSLRRQDNPKNKQ